MFRRVILVVLASAAFACTPSAVLDHAAQVRTEGWWDRIAQCEVGGNWAMHGPTYSGIGFLNATWRQFRYPWMPANAGDATPLEQIAVGERVRWELAPRGSLKGKWGCQKISGAP